MDRTIDVTSCNGGGHYFNQQNRRIEKQNEWNKLLSETAWS